MPTCLTDAPDRIGLRRHLLPQAVPGGGVYLIGEAEASVVHGRHVDDLIGLLDGSRDVPAVHAAMGGLGVAADDVASMLDELDRAGLLVRYRDDGYATRETLAYWDAAGVADACSAADDIARGQVVLRAVGDTDVAGLESALRGAGVGVVPAVDGTAGLVVAACTDYLDPALAAIDTRARWDGTPWLPVKPVGSTIAVGPFLVPGDGPCWSCMAAALATNRAAGPGHVVRSGPAAPTVALPALAATACALAVLEVTKWLAGYRHPDQRRLYTLDSLTLEGRAHDVRRRPQCPACGDPDLQYRTGWRPVSLHPRPCPPGAGHRSAPVSRTLEHCRRLVSPLTGVVAEVRRDRRGPRTFQSFRAGTNRAAAHGPIGSRPTLRWDNGGKGTNAEQAELGALCEAVERFSGAFQGDEATVPGSLVSLGRRAIDPDTWRLYDPRQIAGRSTWNPRHAAFQQVPPAFDPTRRMSWSPVWSLTEGRHRLLPTALLYFGGPGAPGLWADSNGCAAGSSLEDATLQGLLEIVERDAVAIWWYNRLCLPEVPLRAGDDPWLAGVCDAYRRNGREVWALDLTSDLGIPVVAALSRRTGASRDDVMLGFGAHIDPAVALRRGLAELNQVVAAVIDLPDGALPPVADLDLRHWLETASVAAQPYLLPADVPRAPVRCDPGGRDLAGDVAAVRGLIERAGHQVLVLDQTRADLGLPVVRVLAPGMRHFWARFAPGRLFDVPVATGRLAAPTPYESLNPYPVFL